MLSYQRISWPHVMHSEREVPIERFSGTRDAITFRKLPIASPGANTITPSAAFSNISAGLVR